eukprot:1443688-Pleurochrysis_carterae.AAC.1
MTRGVRVRAALHQARAGCCGSRLSGVPPSPAPPLPAPRRFRCAPRALAARWLAPHSPVPTT